MKEKQRQIKIKLNKDFLEKDLLSLLKNSLIEKFNSIKDQEKSTNLEITYLFYHAIVYFQYLNILRANEAFDLYLDYIYSDGQKNKVTVTLYYIDGTAKKLKKNIIEVPLYFDDLLSEVNKFLMNYKLIINTPRWDNYREYIRIKFQLDPHDITIYALIKLIKEIKLHALIALKRHWTTINKEILPYLLEKSQTIKSNVNEKED